MITVPLPVYQTVVANIQGQDGQPLQVVTPLVQVPKLEPGLEGSVEVSAGLNASLNASTIISSGQAQVQVGFVFYLVIVLVCHFKFFFLPLLISCCPSMCTLDDACRSWGKCILFCLCHSCLFK